MNSAGGQMLQRMGSGKQNGEKKAWEERDSERQSKREKKKEDGGHEEENMSKGIEW